MLNVKTLTDTMSRMELPQLQQYAALHKNDPYIVTLALSIANQKKQMKTGQAGQAGMMPQPKVVDQELAQMAPQQQMLPEDQGIGALPAQNMQNFAGGGITGSGNLDLHIPLDLGGGGGGGTYPFQSSSGFAGYNNAPQVAQQAQDQAQRMAQQAHQAGLDTQQAKTAGPLLAGGSMGQFPYAAGGPRPEDLSSMNGTTFGGNPQQSMSQLMGLLGGKSMAGGGIVAFDDGGEVPGYRTGGTPDQEYSDAFNRAYKRLIKVEGGYVGDDAGRGPSMYGVNWTANKDTLKKLGYTEDTVKNLTPKHAKQIYKRDYWDAIGGDKLAKKDFNFANVAFDGAANQGVPTIKPMITKAGDSPYKLLELRQQRYEDLATPKDTDTPAQAERRKEHQKSIKGWTNRTAALKTELDASQNNQRLPGINPSAEAMAATAPASTNSAVNQIPGQSVQAPAAKPEDTGFLSSGYFEQKAEALGMPKDVGRNVFNTLMAPTPAAPITTLPSKGLGLAGLGEKIYNKFVPAAGMSEKQVAALRAETEAARVAEAARASQLPQRLTPPAQVLEQGSQVIPVTKAGEATVQSAADLEKARLAGQATDQLAASQAAARTAAEAAKLPSAAERLQQASYLRESDEAARLMGRANTATNAKTALQLGASAANAPALNEGIADLVPNERIGESVFDPTLGGKLPADAKKDIVDKLKETTGATTGELKQQAADSGMDWNSFLIRFGLGLMAGESQYASVNVGKAGLGALDAQLAAQRYKQTEAAGLADIGYKQAATKKATAEADYLDRFGKDKNLSLEAEKLIAQRMKELPTLMQAQLAGDPARLAAVEKNIRQEIYRQLGIESTMAAGAPRGGAKFIGFENPA